MMKLSRRDFLKLSGAATGTLLIPAKAVRAAEARIYPLHKRISETYSICPYCSCGCGLIAATDQSGHVVNLEGDPENPANRGALDPKSIASRQMANSPLRLQKVLYRAPGATEWEEKDWEWAIPEIAKRIKKTRDQTFEEEDENGVTVNRTQGIAFLGGAANNNEDCYVAVKLTRALGLVNIEHQARI